MTDPLPEHPTRRQVLTHAAGAGLALPFLARGARAADAGVVTVYSSVPSLYLSRIAERVNAAGLGVQLRILSAGSFQIYQRLRSELRTGRLKADLFQVSDISSFVELKRDGALMPYDSEVYAHYPEGHRDPDCTWVNSRSILNIFACNRNEVPDREMPRTWDEYADSRWAGREGNSDARVDGGALNWYYSLRLAKGVGFWKKYAKNRPEIFRGHGALTNRLVVGELALCEQLDYVAYAMTRGVDAPVVAVYPDVVANCMTPLAIMKQAPNPRGAKIVFDWLLSREGQVMLSHINGTYSLRDDVPPLPGKPAFATLPVVKIDPVDYTNSREAMQDEFMQIFDL